MGLVVAAADPVPVAGPTAPTIIPANPTFTNIMTTSATVNWTAASDAVGVTGYQTRVSGGPPTDRGLVLLAAQTGLLAANTYFIEVRAYNAASLFGPWRGANLTTAASGGGGGGTVGYLPGAYSQMSMQGLSIVNDPARNYGPFSGFDHFQGTDAVTGQVNPLTVAIWGGTPGNPTSIQLNQFSAGALVPSFGALETLPTIARPSNGDNCPGSGSLERPYLVNFNAPYVDNSGDSTQCQYLFWPAGGNVGKMYYHREWLWLPSDFAARMAAGGPNYFYAVGESKTGITQRTGFHIDGSTPMFRLVADKAQAGTSYVSYYQHDFAAARFPVPVGQWMFVEYAARPSAGSGGFLWGAVNGRVLNGGVAGNLAYTTDPVGGGSWANGAFNGPTRTSDNDINRLFAIMGYTDAQRSSGSPFVQKVARPEMWTYFPSDASQPHP